MSPYDPSRTIQEKIEHHGYAYSEPNKITAEALQENGWLAYRGIMLDCIVLDNPDGKKILRKYLTKK
jgi:hypothetical protein